jgi:hypothetical protein
MRASSWLMGMFETRRQAAHPSKTLHLARWPCGHRALLRFKARKCGAIVSGVFMQVILVLAAAVIMKAASLHYDFSWATALAAG